MRPDPRPRPVTTRDGELRVVGWRCTGCAHPLTQPVLRCPRCRQAVVEETFAGRGVVFASTCMRVGVPGHEPPYCVAYLVLDDHGPRVFVHTSDGETPLPPGSRARLVAVSPTGDLVASAEVPA